MNHNDTTAEKRVSRRRASSTIALALALTVTLPLQAGSDSKDGPQEPQYSSSDDTYSPKESTARSGAQGGATVEEKQYSSSSAARGGADSESTEAREVALGAHDLTDLIDKDVYSSDGEKIGEISEVVLDFEAGAATRVLIDNEGLFTGSRLVDINALRDGLDEGRVELSMTADEYEQSPIYRKGDSLAQTMTPVWSQAGAPQIAPQPAPLPPSRSGQVGGEEHPAAMQDIDAVESDASLAFCHDVLGREVAALQGEEIGEVEELIQSEDAVYAVVGDLEDELELPDNADRIAIRIDALDMGHDELMAEVALSEIRAAKVAVEPSEGEALYEFGGERIVILASSADFAAIH